MACPGTPRESSINAHSQRIVTFSLARCLCILRRSVYETFPELPQVPLSICAHPPLRPSTPIMLEGDRDLPSFPHRLDTRGHNWCRLNLWA